jgi:polar amino acid transport system substrate-binding protein
MTGWVKSVLLIFLAVVCLTGRAWSAEPDATITSMIADARAAGCGAPSGQLGRILCAGVVRVGVRSDYKSFGMRSGDTYSGFEIDLARRIAQRLGVRLELGPVTPSNRIPLLATGAFDMVIATMGHTVERDRQVVFVRPHYFASPTAVVGPKSMIVSGWPDVAGRAVCVPIGNFSNAVLAQHQARLMIFDAPAHLLDALRLNICSLVAHDRALLVANVTGPDADPSLASKFEEKFAFNVVPWGIGLARPGSTPLDRLLGLILAEMHRSGALIALARANNVDDSFLIEQQKIWSGPDCISADGTLAASCLLPPVNVEEKLTSFAPAVRAFETWLNGVTGWSVSFPMFKGEDALRLFEAGVVNSFIIVAGSIAATLGVALVFQSGLRSSVVLFSVPTRLAVTVLQCSPVIMLLVLGYLVVTLLLSYSTTVAILTAIAVIGLANGSYAASAITEAASSLAPDAKLTAILRLSSVQIMAFVVNAARASAVASFIGAPELLDALTDITSFSSERRTTYVMLLVFYMAIVMAVVALGRVVTRRLEPARAGAA